jgi:hypothetical protein
VSTHIFCTISPDMQSHEIPRDLNIFSVSDFVLIYEGFFFSEVNSIMYYLPHMLMYI